VAEELCQRLEAQPSLRLCVPTGDTPSPMYGRLVGMLAEGRASLADATVVLLDEYVGLPPDDAARCDARLRRELLDAVSMAPRAFHPVRVDDLPPPEAAAEHDAVAAAGLDLAVLGLGGNGHVGLNEPGSTADSPTRVVELAPDSRRSAVDRYGAAREPRAGITLGMDRLLAADEIWLLVTGAGKTAILQRALHGPETPDVPASLLRRHGRLRVMADESAAGRASRL
jgi:glucosamine-6-phosphate deaminase